MPYIISAPHESAQSTSRRQGANFSVASLTRADVEELLLDQRIHIEMCLRTFKLEIMEHMSAEFARLREFISTVVPSFGTATTVAPHDAHHEPPDSGTSPQDTHVGAIDTVPVDRDGTFTSASKEDNAGGGMEPDVPCSDNAEHLSTHAATEVAEGTELTDNAVGTSAPHTSTDVLYTEGGAYELPVEATIPIKGDNVVHTKRCRSTRHRLPAASTRTPYIRGGKKRSKK